MSAHLKSSEHDTELPILQVWLHEIFDEMYLATQLQHASAHYDKTKHREQLVHRPRVRRSQLFLYRLYWINTM